MDKLNVIALDRATFYEELWTFTGQELRIRYALSPYSLQMLCQQHHLPAPPVGYWVKVRHGKKVKRPPLPNVSDPGLQRVYLLTNDPEHSRLCHDPIPLPPALVDPHPRVAELRQQCHQIGTNLRTEPPPLGQIGFAVGPKGRDRALRLLDTLVKAFESAGGELFQSSQGLLWGRRPDGVGIGIETATAPDVAESAEERLVLVITTNAQVAIKNTWSDTNSQDLARSLRPIVNAIFESAARLRWRRLERECRARQDEKAAALRRAAAEAEQAVLDEQTFGRKVLEEAKQFHEASLIRRYARAVRRRLAGTPQAPAVEQWAHRAMRYTDSVDPLLKRFPAAASLPAPTSTDDLDITGELRLFLVQSGITDTHGMYRLAREQRPGLGRDAIWREIHLVLSIRGYSMPHSYYSVGGPWGRY